VTWNPLAPAPGIYHGVTPEAYHASIALSRSRLATLVDGTPLDFFAGEPPEESAAMRLGTAAHLAILEPDRFDALVRPLPKFDMRTTVGKHARAAWDETNPGAIAVPEDDYEVAVEAAAMVRRKKGPATALREGGAELSLCWRDGAEYLRARPDFASVERGIVVDVKTTKRDLSDRQAVTVLTDGYAALQASMITQGILALTGKKVATYLLMVRLARPVDMRLVHIGDLEGGPLDWLELGDAQLERALRVYRQCAAQGSWPGHAEAGVTNVAMPPWIKSRAAALTQENMGGAQ